MKSKRSLNGYVVIYLPDHPAAMSSKNWDGYVYEHIVVAEKKIGRRLRSNEEVHHLDLDRTNNNPSNLIVLEKSQHVTLHNWISKGAPISKGVGVNGVNSGKSKVTKTKYCKLKSCSNVLFNTSEYCSRKCAAIDKRKVDRPSKEQLKSDMSTMSFSAMGRKYMVSDNAVRKWAKQYGLL